jgi:molybdate transport system ATP-binding protein
LQVDIRIRLESDKSGAFELNAAFSADGGITILFGPSGSGKTTILRAISGILTPESGIILVQGRTFFDSVDKINVSIQERRVGFVFQDFALFPHMTAEQNVLYGIKEKKESVRRERAREILAAFGIQALRERYPNKLSGGEQQRVALARALASDPSVVLLDEPLSAVDSATRARLVDEIEAAQLRFGIPFLYVTHNTSEAIRLGHQVVVLENGRVKAIGKPSDLFSLNSQGAAL